MMSSVLIKCFTLTRVDRDAQGNRIAGGELQSADIFALWEEQMVKTSLGIKWHNLAIT